jgi:hypothetical protein
MRPVVIAGAILAVLATGPAIFAAWLTRVNICGGACHNSLFDVQLVLAVVGLLPAGTLIYATWTGRRRLAVLSLVTGLVVYALWGLLNDAAVHGWANL